VHAVGYCIGGTLLAALLAWVERGEAPSPVAHWTLLTTLVDFTQPGDIDVFIDEDSVRYIERMMERRGYLDGQELALSFRMLRSNSLIWHYVVHNYLYGEDVPQFDVLYWNTDCTRLPEAMHSFYLRELYLANKLARPDGLTLGGRPLDLGRIQAPLYVVGTEQDHIAPWRETFKVCALVGAPVRYVLATSGHIIGIVNPPVDPPKRRYWVGDATGATDPLAWRDGMEKVPGSWWEDWNAWLAERCGPLGAPPPMGNGDYPALGDAPGTYVLER
jgi:polyhydroxyalkanoate synthase